MASLNHLTSHALHQVAVNRLDRSDLSDLVFYSATVWRQMRKAYLRGF
jgi:hypothetical protein